MSERFTLTDKQIHSTIQDSEMKVWFTTDLVLNKEMRLVADAAAAHVLSELAKTSDEELVIEIAKLLSVRFVYGRDEEFCPLNYNGLAQQERDNAIKDARNLLAKVLPVLNALREQLKQADARQEQAVKAIQQCNYPLCRAKQALKESK